MVPGCYGMASAKWLIDAIAVSETPFRGYFNTLDYAVWRPDERNIQHRVPLERDAAEMRDREPRQLDAMVPEKGEFTIKGLAWGGDAADSARRGQRRRRRESGRRRDFIRRRSAARVALLASIAGRRHAAAGSHVIRARAIDANRRVQASEHDPRNGAYVIDHSLPLEVYVRLTRFRVQRTRQARGGFARAASLIHRAVCSDAKTN